MKTTYRDHEIKVTREKCLGGWDILYFSIFRIADLYECLSGFEDSEDNIEDKIQQLKNRIDDELLEKDPWCELEGGGE